MRKEIICIVVIYIALCLIFFSSFHLAHKIVLPLLFLSIAAVRYRSLPMFFAMLFSAIGDYAGSCHVFLLQMGSFALAHVAFISYFLCVMHKHPKISHTQSLSLCSIICSMLFVVVVVTILPVIDNNTFLIGVSLYLTLILIMLMMAWLTGYPIFLAGAFLFVLSDSILGWNKFVSKIPFSAYWIMIPYFSAQILFFIQAAKLCRFQGIKNEVE